MDDKSGIAEIPPLKLKRPFNFRLFPFMLLAVGAGIYAGATKSAGIILLSLTAAAVYALAACSITKQKLKVVLVCACVAVGAVNTYLTLAAVENRAVTAENAAVSGRVCEGGETDGEYTEFTIEDVTVNGEKLKGKTLVTLYAEDLNYCIPETGYYIAFVGDIAPAGLDPFDSYSVSNYDNGYTHCCILDLITDYDSGALTGSEKTRKALFNALDVLGEEVKGTAYALIVGDTSYMDEEAIEAYRNTGTAHLFAVSGFNVAILFSMIMWILKRLKTGDKLKFFIVTFFLIMYCSLTGWSPSILRATIMASLYLLGGLLGRRRDALSIFSFSGLGMLIFKPVWLFDISFIFSYASVFGIIMFFDVIDDVLKKIPHLPKIIRETASLTLAVNLLILPITIGYFEQFSPLFLLANVVLVPVVSGAYVLLVAGAVFAVPLNFLNSLMVPGGWLLQIADGVAKRIAALPYASLEASAPAAAFYPYFFGLALASPYSLLKRPEKEVSLAAGLIISLALLIIL